MMGKEEEKKLRQKVLIQLNNSYYEERGFSLNKTTAIFSKGCLTVRWGVSSKGIDHLIFKPQFQISNSKIENKLLIIFPDKSNVVSVKSQNLLFAEKLKITNFKNSKFVILSDNGIGFSNYLYRIYSDTDLTAIIKDHIDFMEKVTFPYFEKLSTVRGISDYFNNRLLSLSDEELKDREVMKSFQKEEVLSSIIASYLEKEERLNKVIETYKKLYSISEFYLNDINLLDNWIKGQNELS